MTAEQLLPQIRAAIAIAPGLAKHISAYEYTDECHCCGHVSTHQRDHMLPIDAYRTAAQARLAHTINKMAERVIDRHLDLRETAFFDHLKHIKGDTWSISADSAGRSVNFVVNDG